MRAVCAFLSRGYRDFASPPGGARGATARSSSRSSAMTPPRCRRRGRRHHVPPRRPERPHRAEAEARRCLRQRVGRRVIRSSQATPCWRTHWFWTRDASSSVSRHLSRPRHVARVIRLCPQRRVTQARSVRAYDEPRTSELLARQARNVRPVARPWDVATRDSTRARRGGLAEHFDAPASLSVGRRRALVDTGAAALACLDAASWQKERARSGGLCWARPPGLPAHVSAADDAVLACFQGRRREHWRRVRPASRCATPSPTAWSAITGAERGRDPAATCRDACSPLI